MFGLQLDPITRLIELQAAQLQISRILMVGLGIGVLVILVWQFNKLSKKDALAKKQWEHDNDIWEDY